MFSNRWNLKSKVLKMSDKNSDNLQLNSRINKNFNNILLAIAEPDENGVNTSLHGSDAYENHADED